MGITWNGSVWIDDATGQPYVQPDWNPNDPAKVAAATAKAWQDSYNYYIGMGYDAETAGHMADKDTGLYLRNNALDSKLSDTPAPMGTMGAAEGKTVGSISSTSLLDSYQQWATGYRQQQDVAEAKKMALSTIPMQGRGQRKFADQTKPGQKKSKWGWWS